MLSPLHSTGANCEHCQALQSESDAASTEKVRLLWIALGLIGGFAIAELIVGWFSHSLALMAESVHMVSDCLALVLALVATWIARLPASDKAPFGYRRIEVLAALANGIGLVLIAAWIATEAIEHLQTPSTDILSLPMLLTAIAGLGVNTLSASLLHQHSHHDLNVRGVFLHMVADAASSIGVIVAAIVIWQWHWTWMDGIMSFAVAALILLSAIPLIRQSLQILLEQSPNSFPIDELRSQILSFDGVLAVEHLRLWTIAPGQNVLMTHLKVNLSNGEARDRLLCDLQAALKAAFFLSEIYIQTTSIPVAAIVNLSTPLTVPETLASANREIQP